MTLIAGKPKKINPKNLMIKRTNTPQREEWEKEFLTLTSRLIGQRVTLDKTTGSYFKPGQMYEIMEGIKSFISQVRTQAIEEERERIREIIKNSDYGDGSCDTNDLLTHLNKK